MGSRQPRQRPPRYVSDDESELIRFQLSLKDRPREVKAGLQRLCNHYEQNRRLAEPHPYRIMVRGLLWDDARVVRRWAYKTLATIGEDSDKEPVVSRLATEVDGENQTFGMAAIIGLSENSSVREVCAQTGLEQSTPILLAARLFATDRWLRENDEKMVVNVDHADSLTLKWAALLSGYGRAPSNLFHPSHENRILLGELNGHPTSEVSEYSVWAFWKNPNYKFDDLRIPLHALAKTPDNVRRWTNRLLTKDPDCLRRDLSLFDELTRDKAVNAREGLALGIQQIYVPQLDNHVLDWHDHEPEDSIRELLLEHMAFSSTKSQHYFDLVVQSYERAARAGSIRKRLLAASQGQKLYGSLRRISLKEQATDVELPLHPPFEAKVLVLNGDFNMGNTTFRAGRDITGQNLVGGDMVASANAAVQSMSAARANEQTSLADLLRFIQSAKGVSDEDKQKALTAITQVAQTGTPAAKKGLVETLTKISSSTTAVTETANQISKFSEIVSGWLT